MHAGMCSLYLGLCVMYIFWLLEDEERLVSYIYGSMLYVVRMCVLRYMLNWSRRYQPCDITDERDQQNVNEPTKMPVSLCVL